MPSEIESEIIRTMTGQGFSLTDTVGVLVFARGVARNRVQTVRVLVEVRHIIAVVETGNGKTERFEMNAGPDLHVEFSKAVFGAIAQQEKKLGTYTERDMLDLLAQRYTDIRRGTIADRWVVADHVRATLGYSRTQRIADFVAADKYPGYPYGSTLAFHWHEVKVDRGDWLRELREPEKSEVFRRHMHHWWIVAPSTDIVHLDEVPEGWGLIVTGAKGMRARVKGPRHEPEPMPADMVISLMSAAARTAHRAPLNRDAPVAHVKTWDDRCGWCGELSPCSVHQPRMARSRRG